MVCFSEAVMSKVKSKARIKLSLMIMGSVVLGCLATSIWARNHKVALQRNLHSWLISWFLIVLHSERDFCDRAIPEEARAVEEGGIWRRGKVVSDVKCGDWTGTKERLVKNKDS